MNDLSTTGQLLALSAAWLIYFLLHSLLASLQMKHWVARKKPDWMPAYRLFFNVLASLLIIPPLAMSLAFRGPPLWTWSGPWQWISLILTTLAILCFIWSLRYYDGLEFLGFRQLHGRIHDVEDQERLYISPMHRYVRHPWYFLGLVLVWTRDMDQAFLTSALAITLYFALGSRLEERKLLIYHGESYRRYRARVPGLIPRPWRYLSREQARRITAGDSEQIKPSD